MVNGFMVYFLVHMSLCSPLPPVQSLWNKFFQDKELRGMIKQDVMRT